MVSYQVFSNLSYAQNSGSAAICAGICLYIFVFQNKRQLIGTDWYTVDYQRETSPGCRPISLKVLSPQQLNIFQLNMAVSRFDVSNPSAI